MRGSQETHLSPKVDSYLPPPPYFTDGDFSPAGEGTCPGLTASLAGYIRGGRLWSRADLGANPLSSSP